MRLLLVILALLILGLALLVMSGGLDYPSTNAEPVEPAAGDPQDDAHRFDVESGTLSEGLAPANDTTAP